MTDLISNIENQFEQVFNQKPQIIVRSPGRINLIGEHTDYNDGFVLPAAIDKAVYLAVSAREDDECHFVAHDLKECYKTTLHNLVKTDEKSWANYLMGVIKTISDMRYEISDLSPKSEIPYPKSLRGINLVFGGDLPSGGGVSSSAAIENGIGFAINHLFNLGLTRLELVKISQQSENNFVGMQCGVMDMFASMMGQERSVIRLDCRSLAYEYFPFDTSNYILVLCDTRVKHALVDSEYNTRRAECEEGIAILKKYDPSVLSLRDVNFEFLLSHQTDLSEVVFRRCKYVVEEIARVEKACKALIDNDLEIFGALMYATHDGLNLEYEVSCPELNFLVEMARLYPYPSVLGARMMGGGFGGCTLNLVKKEAADDFISTLSKAYLEKFNIDMLAYKVVIENGTMLVA